MDILSKLRNKTFSFPCGERGDVFVRVSNCGGTLSLAGSRRVGIWVFFQSTLLFVDTFRSGFLTTAFIKFCAGSEPGRAKEVTGSTWYIALAITGGFILINIPLLFFAGHIHKPGNGILS